MALTKQKVRLVPTPADSRPGRQSGAVPEESFSRAIITIMKHSAPSLAMAILRAALDIRAIWSGLGSGGGGLGFGRMGR